MEPDVLFQFVDSAAQVYLPKQPNAMLKLMDEMSKMDRFSMTLMCVEASDRTRIENVCVSLADLIKSERCSKVVTAWSG